MKVPPMRMNSTLSTQWPRRRNWSRRLRAWTKGLYLDKRRGCWPVIGPQKKGAAAYNSTPQLQQENRLMQSKHPLLNPYRARIARMLVGS